MTVKTRETPATETPAELAKLRAEALANDWDLPELLKKASQLDDQSLARALVVMRSGHVIVMGVNEDHPWNATETLNGIPQWAWKAILETEAGLRDSFPMSVQVRQQGKKAKTKNASRRTTRTTAPGPGKTSSEVTDAKEMRRIWAACRKNGGGMSYEQAEREFGLREMKGMTAYRVCQKHEKRSKT